MFEALERRVAEEAALRVEETLSNAEAQLAKSPGLRATRESGAVRIEGRGLMRRFLEDARLRFGGWR